MALPVQSEEVGEAGRVVARPQNGLTRRRSMPRVENACSPFESPWASAGSLILLFSCSTLAPLLRYRCIAPTLPPTFDLSSEMTFASFDPQK